MIIELRKFGVTLTSRDDGREALAAFQGSLNDLNNTEDIEIVFTGVNTFSPSWGDEFLAPLIKQFGSRLIMVDAGNLSVVSSLDLLERVHHIKFIRSHKKYT